MGEVRVLQAPFAPLPSPAAPLPPGAEFYPYFGNGGRRLSKALRAQTFRLHSAPAPPPLPLGEEGDGGR